MHNPESVRENETKFSGILRYKRITKSRLDDYAFWTSSSCCATSTDFPDPLSPPVSIVHHSREVFKAISCIGTELSYIGSCWSSCLCSSMWRGLQEYIAYKFVHTSPAVSGSFNLHSFSDGWEVAAQLLFCGVLPQGLVQYCSQHSCVIAVKPFLHAFS